MGKILTYFKGSLGPVFLIFLLLVVQVYSDLALPAYTSDIVDVGIQQGGITEVAPEKMRAETFENLCLFMTDEQIELVRSAYETDGENFLVRTANDRETLDTLNDVFQLPMVILVQMASGGNSAGGSEMSGTQNDASDTQQNASGAQNNASGQPSGILPGGMAPRQFSLDQIKTAMRLGLVKKEQILEMAASQLETMGAGSELLIRQGALQFVKSEYEAIGMNLASIQTRYMLITGGKMLGLTLVSVAAAIIVGLIGSRLAAGVGKSLRAKIYHKVMAFSNADIEKFSTASLITRNTNDVQMVVMAMVMLVRIVFYAPMMGIGGAIRVAGTDTGMSWIIVVAVALLLAVFAIVLNIAMPKFQKMQQLIDRLNMVSREVLSGLPVIRAFSRERYEKDRLDVANRDLTRTQLFTSRVMSFTMPLMMLLMNGTVLAILWFGGNRIDTGNLQVGQMMAFMNYSIQIVMSFLMLAMITVFLPRAIVAAGRIEEVLQTEPSIADRADVRDDELADYHGEVAFENVSFRYPDAEEDMLEGITFTAKPGRTTAIIGPTGSGKSTLIHLIPRFYDVTGGKITIDGLDIRELSQKKLRGLIGYVPQKGVLFSGDIESNIKFGGDFISDDDMAEAAEIAQAAGFIDEKEEKYQSPIAQGGSNVSGGQRQRLSIARAIAKRSKILLFDDSFSALDYRTDVRLRRALSEKLRDATVIIVAQRISTILHADQIVVLEEGKAVGIGTHRELMENCEAYREIARSQLSDEELKGGTA